MTLLADLAVKCLSNSSQALVKANTSLTGFCRYASKKSSATGKGTGNTRAKHRGWKYQDGVHVQAGTILVMQNKTRFHPGLNVGFGRNGNLFAMRPGKVVVTCEKINPNWEHSWIKRNYGEQERNLIYKKHFNIIPEPRHNRFKLIDKI